MATTDLIRYVAEEIAADGPEGVGAVVRFARLIDDSLGSSWERLNSFIDDYSNHLDTALPDQLVDEDLRTYIVEALVRLPNLFPGRFVAAVKASGSANTAKSKGKRKQAEDSEESEDEEDDNGKRGQVVTARAALSKTVKDEDHVEVQDGDKDRSLQELRATYGSHFRLVADEASLRDSLGNVEDCPSSVTPLLHYVMRSRGQGVSFTEIGNKFKFNTSLIFFLVKALITNDLGIKFRASNGRAQVSWVVAKRYAHLCPYLKDSINENAQEDDEAQDGNEDDAGDETARIADDLHLQEMSPDAVEEMLRGRKRSGINEQEEGGDDADLQDDDIDQGEEEEEIKEAANDAGLMTLHGLLAYRAASTRLQQKTLIHDRSLVRLRILKLLKSSKNNATIRADLILRIGIKQPDPSDRKIFNATLRQLEREELIERCLLKRPLHNNKDHTEQCWMATSKGVAHYDALTSSSQQRQIMKMRLKLAREIESSRSKLTVESSFARQLLENVDLCGAAGTTINQLTVDFGGNRDRHRDLDHILSVLKKSVNKHFADYCVFSALEQSGRTRSQRFWTRQWRPSKLAPQEPREMSSSHLSTWIGVPGEVSFLTIDKWRRRQGNQIPKPGKRVKEDEDDDSDISNAHKKVKSNGGDLVKGRPRKNFTESAEKAAKRYQDKKALRQREEEERRGVESLLGEEASLAGPSRVKKLRKTRADPPSGSEIGISTMEDYGDDQSDVQEGQSEQRLMNADASTVNKDNGPIDPALVSRSKARVPQAPRKSVNLTLQLKYDTLLEFFSEKGMVEGSHFEHEYRKKVRSIVGQGGDTQQYEMDRKVRNKLFHSLEKAGIIQCKKVPAPAMSKDQQRVIWHICNVEEGRLIAFCRKVSEGTLRPLEQWSNSGGKERAVLDSTQIDAPESFFTGMGINVDFEAKNIDEFLDNDRIHSIMLRFPNIQASYTGRLPGLGSRLHFLHKTVFEMINDNDKSSFVLDDGKFDLNWWASEATLGQYLKLASPPSNRIIMEASQNANILRLPIKDVGEDLNRALQLSPEGDGCYQTLKPLLEYLGVFGLAEPVNITSDQDKKESNLVYRFAAEGIYTGWTGALELKQAADTFNFDLPMQVEQYWRQVQSDCILMKPVDDLDDLPLLHANLYNALRRKSAWYGHYRLFKPQQAFLFKTISLGVDQDVVDDAELLLRISRASMTPIHILKRYYERRCSPEKGKRRSTGMARSNGDGRNKTAAKVAGVKETPLPGTKLTVRQANAIRRKAQEVVKVRVAEFDDVLEACFAGLKIEDSSRKIISDNLINLRREYGRGDAGINLKRIRQMFEDLMKLHKEGEQTWNTIVNRRKVNRASTRKGDETEKKKGKDGSRSRKAAIEWTKARDELLRDAIVILRCRDRNRNPANPRKNWKALEQIFPDPSANSLKSRFDKICELVGEEAYLSQLEAEWETLWATHRGTDELEDSDPKHPTDFDLMGHIEFLRTNINKLAVADKVDNETGESLPLEASKLPGLYDYERPPASEMYDAYAALARYSATDASVETRTAALRGHAFTLESHAILPAQGIEKAKDDPAKKQSRRERGRAIALVKMIQCTSEANYNEAVATKLSIDNAREETMDEAIKELQDLKIIKRKAKEERELPNRNFVFSLEYFKFHEDAFETLPFWDIVKGYHDFVQKRQAVVFRQSRDEEIAAYLTLLSQDQVKVEIDLRVVEKIKMDKLFNAKTITDSTLEMPIQLSLGSSANRTDLMKRCLALLQSQPDEEVVLQWLGEGEDSVSSRVDKVWKQWIASLRGDKQILARRLQSIFHDEVEVNGITKENLKMACPSKHLKSLLQAAQGFSPPLVFQYGYEETLLISSRYLSSWTIRFESGKYTFPYKWYNVYGQWNREEWMRALQLVVHAIITRPGITLAQLLVQFRIALDRMEVCRLIQFACEAGIVKKLLSCNDQVQGGEAEWEARNDVEVAFVAL